MFWKKIRTVGDIYIDSRLKDGQGIRIANEFFCKLIEGFAKHSNSYIRVTGEAPFAFSEKQLHSILAPALAGFTNAFLMEPPVNRRWSTISDGDWDDSHGWVDYWCYYREIVFLIELKHGFISSRHAQFRKNIKVSWKTAINQIEAIKDEAKIHAEGANGAFRVAISILPIFETANNKSPKTIDQIDSLLGIQKACLQEFDPAPNWTGLWALHKDLIGPYQYLNSTEYYPGVLFIAKISEIHK